MMISIKGVISSIAFAWLLAAIPLHAVDGVGDFQCQPDNRVVVMTSLGVRYARPLSEFQVELGIGLSVGSAAADPAAYRVISDTDPNYAYEKFVTPTNAMVQTELEAVGPGGCLFKKFEKTVVRLELPHPLQVGQKYFIIAQGAHGQMVTGGHTAGEFIFNADQFPALPDNAVDLAVLGLRQLESVGNGIIRLEFGPDFSPSAAGNFEHYTVQVNGTQVKPVNYGRQTKIDTYLPIRWPLQAIPMHSIFLQLPAPLADGDKIEVEVSKDLTTAGNKAAVVFNAKSTHSNSIKINQIGYLTDSPVKVGYLGRWLGSFPELAISALEPSDSPSRRPALAFPSAPEFKVSSVHGAAPVFVGTSTLVHVSGKLNEGVYKVDYSGENVYLLDFTSFTTPGEYYLSVAGVGRSLPFTIGEAVYKTAFEIQAAGVFAQRCGLELKPPYSDWHRIACHTNGLKLTLKYNYEGEWADSKRIVMQPDKPGEPVVIPAAGGHHDAGDYNPRSHLEVAQKLLDAYELAPQKFYDGQLNIPEHANGIPDILDEAFWALRLWIDLQDKDGGVFDGTEAAGDPNFTQTVELDSCGDYAYPKDAAGSYNFAGAFAAAARIWRSIGKGTEADDFLSRAKRAYDWAEKNPDKFKTDTQTGMLCLSRKAYAAAELLRTTREAKYNRDFLGVCFIAKNPTAPLDDYGKYDQQLAGWAYAQCKAEDVDPVVQANVKKAIIRTADLFITYSATMGYAFIKNPWSPINWGTGAYENFLPVVVWSYKLTGDRKYLYWIIRTCDNTLGANPLNLSYIVGAGPKTIRAPLHNSRYGHTGEVVTGIQCEGPVQKGDCYRVVETTYPKIRDNFACLHTFVDAHFAIGMDEGVVVNQAQTMAVFGLLLPDRK